MIKVIRYLLECVFSPARAVYNPDNAISVITCDGSLFEREIVQFTSDSCLNLMGSLWRDRTQPGASATICTIYLHSLGTNQFESINVVPFLCTPELALFTFDFPGCGISEGTRIPLDGSGCELVLAAVRSLRARFSFAQFALWGRSLGASIALHTVSTSNDFRCVVADSPFASTRDFIYDQATSRKIPKCLVRMAFPLFSREARRLIEMNVDYPFPIQFVPFAHTPLMLGHGTGDQFIPLAHSERLFVHYGDPRKQLYPFHAKHNTPRPYHWYQTAARFIYRQTGLDRVVRSYNWVFARSHLHIGNIQTVIQDIQEAWHIPVERPQALPTGTAAETRERTRQRGPLRRWTDSEGDVEEADDCDLPEVPTGTLASVNLVFP
jgi:pimeloyl-ACP methyl ester carboxylesterase